MPEAGDRPGLKRDEALVAWIQQSAPYGVIMLNWSLEIQGWNHWMELHSGLAYQDVAGKKLFELFPGLRQRGLAAPFERALAGESIVLSTGLHHYLLPLAPTIRETGFDFMRQTARLSPLHSDGLVRGVVVVIEDVTQRESQAALLRRQHRRDEILSSALAYFLKSAEPHKTVRPLFFKIAEHMDFDTFFLYLRNAETGELSLYTTGGIPEEMDKDFANYPLLAAVADSPDSVVFNALEKESDPAYALLKQSGATAAIAIPLVVNRRNIGLLCFATGTREIVTPDESDLLATIAQYLATAVDRENTNLQLQKAQQELFDHSQLLEKKVHERTSRLQETISELETFSYTVAHDLKAPVRGMSGYCEVLLEDFGERLPQGAGLVIKKLLRSSRRMEALIQDLLAFTRISREDVTLAPIEIEPLLEDVLALRAPGARGHHRPGPVASGQRPQGTAPASAGQYHR